MMVGSGGSQQSKVIGECAGSHLHIDLYSHISIGICHLTGNGVFGDGSGRLVVLKLKERV